MVDGDVSGDSAPSRREILGPRTWIVVAVAAVLYATVQPVANYLQYSFESLSFVERLEAISPAIGPATAFGYLLAALAALAAYRTVQDAWLRRLLGLICLLSALVAAFGVLDIWHLLTIHIHGLTDENQTLSLDFQQSEWQQRIAGMLYGALGIVLAGVTIWLALPIARERAEIERSRAGDGGPPEPVDLTPVR